MVRCSLAEESKDLTPHVPIVQKGAIDLQGRAFADIDMKAITSIQVSRAEDAIRARLGELSKATKALEAEVRKIEKAMRDELEGFSRAEWLARADLVTSVMGFAEKFSDTYTVSYGATTFSEKTDEFVGSVSICFKESGTLVKQLRKPVSKEYLLNRRELAEKSAALKDSQERAHAARRALGNIEALERSANAAVARELLKKSEDGKAVISALDGMNVDASGLIERLSN